MNLKQSMAVILMLLLSVQAIAEDMKQAENKSGILTKAKLETLTRGGVINKRLSSKDLRILCEDREIPRAQACANFGFYLSEGKGAGKYQVTKLGRVEVSYTQQEAAEKMLEASHWYYTDNGKASHILLFILALFLPILIIPIGIAVAIDSVGRNFQNARITALNARLVRIQSAFARGRARNVIMSAKKFGMTVAAFENVLSY